MPKMRAMQKFRSRKGKKKSPKSPRTPKSVSFDQLKSPLEDIAIGDDYASNVGMGNRYFPEEE